MISPRPFQAHQFALLHLLGLLSISRPQDDAHPETSLQDPDFGGLLLPQEVIINAFCYLTEQIHEVAAPPLSLDDLVSDVYFLATKLVPATRVGRKVSTFRGENDTSASASKNKGSASTKKKRASTRSPAKRAPASTSPSAPGTRSLRRSSSRPTLASSSDMGDEPSALLHDASPLASTSMMMDEAASPLQPSAFVVDGKKPDKRKGTYSLAERLHANVHADILRMVEDRSEAFFASLLEFRVLLGELNNPNNVAFLDRQSPLGMWLRRALLILNTMAFQEIESLIDDVLFWGGLTDSPRDMENGILFSVSSAVPTDVNTLKTRAVDFEQYEESMKREDYSKSLDLMMRFFDYETFPLAGGIAANRGMRQHALLNLANFHFLHEEYPSARIAAVEGMKVARQTSDLVTLNALAGLMRRIVFEDTSDRPDQGQSAVGTSPHDTTGDDHAGHTTPMDSLWDVRYGMATRIPVPALAFDLFRAKALYYNAVNQKMTLSPKERRKEKKMAIQQGKDPATVGSEGQQRRLRWNRLDRTAFLATSADLWEELGSQDLASTYRTIAPISRGAGDVDPTGGARLAIICQTAIQLARNGSTSAALATLLVEVKDLETSQLTVRDVQSWQRAVYGVLRLQARRSGNDTLEEEIDRVTPPQPVSAGFPARHTAEQQSIPLPLPTITVASREASGFLGEVDSLIQKADKYLDMDQPSLALPLAMKAISLSSIPEGQGLVALYKRSVLVVVRVQVAFGTCDRALRILNDHWSDILGAQDMELLAVAKEVRARTLIALVEQASAEEKETGQAKWKPEEPAAANAEAANLIEDAAALQLRLGNVPERIRLLTELEKLHQIRNDLPAHDRIAEQARQLRSTWQLERPVVHRRQMEQFQRFEFICACASAAIAAS